MSDRMKLFIFLSIISLCLITADSTDVRELVIQEKATETVSVPMAAISEVVEKVEPTVSTALASGVEVPVVIGPLSPPAGKKKEIIVSEKVIVSEKGEQKARITKYGPTGNRMASGKYPYVGAVATSDRKIPFGTKVFIDGEEYVVEDRTASWIHTKFGLTFDIFSLESRKDLLSYGVKKRGVVIILK